MYPLLLAAIVALATSPTQQQNQPGQKPTPQAQGTQGQRDSSPPMSIDGNWTVLCLEKNGQPMTNAKDVTVSIRDNVVTFNCPANTAEKDKVRSMRLEFTQGGKIRVTEAGADGKFSNTSTTPNATTGNANSGSSGHDAKTGVYVLAHDYFSICVHDESGREGGVVPAGARDQAGKPSGKSHCTVFLKRSDSSSSRPNR